jgi:hypothetical protein
MPMTSPDKSEAFYKKLKAQLQDTAMWPTEYLYKFIVTTDKEKISSIETLFDNLGAVINTTPSKNNKYTSVSINVRMKNPDAVINKYKEVAEKVKDVIAL